MREPQNRVSNYVEAPVFFNVLSNAEFGARKLITIMGLKRLIENQTIRIDNHHHGDGVALNWVSKKGDIHIHKIVNRSGKHYEFKVPLNVERIISSSDFDIMPDNIREEILDAFQDKRKRQEFVKTLYDILINYSSIISNGEKAFQALERVCDYFGLVNGTRQEVLQSMRYVIEFSERESRYIAKMNEKSISVGQKIGH